MPFMGILTLTARVRKDGSLAISKAQREKMQLLEGDEVELTLTSTKLNQLTELNPLLKLIGISNDGPSDGSVRHDTYIYRDVAS